MNKLEKKLTTLVSALLLTTTLNGCTTILKPKPVDVRFLNNKMINYAVTSPTYAKKIIVNDLEGNTICLTKDVKLTPNQTPVGLSFCNLNVNQEYEVETITDKETYKDRIYSSY